MTVRTNIFSNLLIHVLGQALIMERLSGKQTAEVTAAMIARLTPYKERFHTIISDNGKEFAGHEEIAKALEIDFFFCPSIT